MPVFGTFRVQTPWGGFLYQSRGEHLGKVLFWRGIHGFEAGTATVFARLLEQTDGAFLDVGAYSAYYTLFALSQNPRRECICFEPIPALRAWIAHHFDLNAAWDVARIVDAAASDSAGSATFFGSGHALSPGGSLIAGFKERSQPLIDVKTVRIDEVAADVRVGLVKIDTEGVELEVLRGAENVLRSQRPFVICEVLPGEDGSSRADELNHFLSNLGYALGAVTADGVRRLDRISVDDGREQRNFVFWHRSVDPW